MDTIDLFQGDDWEIPFQYTVDGDPLDITGVTEIEACFKAASTPSIISVTLTDDEITIINAPAGKIMVNVPQAKSALIKKGKSSVQVIKTDVNSKEKTHQLDDLINVLERSV